MKVERIHTIAPYPFIEHSSEKLAAHFKSTYSNDAVTFESGGRNSQNPNHNAASEQTAAGAEESSVSEESASTEPHHGLNIVV